jgi:hypothetical protein
MPATHKADVRELYRLVHLLFRGGHATPPRELPLNGIYFFFERGELALCDGRTVDRIVRVGTHRGYGRFRTTIRQHYGHVGSRGSDGGVTVFRKHVAAAILRRADPHERGLGDWLTDGGEHFPELNAQVNGVLCSTFTFACLHVDEASERLRLESGLIALLAQHPLGGPSRRWLGRHAVTNEIRSSGLWNTRHLDDDPLPAADLSRIDCLVPRPSWTRGHARLWMAE